MGLVCSQKLRNSFPMGLREMAKIFFLWDFIYLFAYIIAKIFLK